MRSIGEWLRNWWKSRPYDGGESNKTVLDHLRRLDTWKLVKKEC
jgi:hypothetical protein